MGLNHGKDDGKDAEVKASGKSFLGGLGRDFILGCLAFLPLVVLSLIIYYLVLSIRFVAGFFFVITDSKSTSFALITLVVLLLIYTGRKLRLQEKWTLTTIEGVIFKIPVIGGWYQVFKDLIGTFTAAVGDRGYLGTVRVPFGSGYIIGFVTKKEAAADGSVNVTVFVPTSPNPTTGLVFFFPESSVSYMDISAEQAFSKVISLGTKG